MKKSLLMIFIIILFTLNIVFAYSEEEFSKAEDIITQKIPCEELTDNQLESIGDYYMEQMHPVEAHVTMDEILGGEGSENLRQIHINMAKSFYCGEHNAMSLNMMDMMMGRGMMNLKGGNNMVYSMMGYVGMGLYGLIYLALGAFIFSVIFWLTRNWLVKNKK